MIVSAAGLHGKTFGKPPPKRHSLKSFSGTLGDTRRRDSWEPRTARSRSGRNFRFPEPARKVAPARLILPSAFSGMT